MQGVVPVIFASFFLLSAASASAAFVSFDLTRSDILRDGPDYLRVTIDDQGAAGLINFHVSALGALRNVADRKFGIDEFAFNSAFGLSSSNIVGLPKNWKVGGADTVSNFGRFDESVEAKNSGARVTSLAFSISGIKWDTVSSYILASSGRAREGNFFFAAHVAGIDGEFNCVSGASFAGSLQSVPLLTPLPAAAWLLAPGLGLFGFAFRRRAGVRVAG